MGRPGLRPLRRVEPAHPELSSPGRGRRAPRPLVLEEHHVPRWIVGVRLLVDRRERWRIVLARRALLSRVPPTTLVVGPGARRRNGAAFPARGRAEAIDGVVGEIAD